MLVEYNDIVILTSLTKCQECQQDNHVQTDHQSTSLCRRNLGQEERRGDSQASCSQATKDSRKEHESIDARRENLHQDADSPDADGELIGPQTTDAIIEEDGDERAKGSTQHTEGRDVRFAICEGGSTTFPVGFAQVEVIDKRCELGAC